MQFLISFNITEEKAVTLANNDPIGRELKQAKKCLDENYGEYPRYTPHDDKQDSNTFGMISVLLTVIGTVIAAVIGAYYTVKKTQEKRINEAREIGKTTIESGVTKIEEILKKKRPYHDPKTSMTLSYVNQKISTTPFKSVISSGSFLYFSTGLQSALDTLYFQVEYHNNTLSELERLVIKAKTERLRSSTKQMLLDLMLQLVITEENIQDECN